MSKKKMYAEGDEIALGTTHAVLDACLGKKVHFSLDLCWVDVDLEPYIYKLAHCLLNCAHCNLQRRAVAAYGIVLSASTYGYERVHAAKASSFLPFIFTFYCSTGVSKYLLS